MLKRISTVLLCLLIPLTLLAGITSLSTNADATIRPAACHAKRCHTTQPTTAPTTITTAPTTTATTTPTSGPSDYLPGYGTPVWSDEFNGTAVDTTKWNVRNNDTANGMLERRMAANVTEHDGVLDEQARKENIPGTTQQYTSGFVDTIGKDAHVGPGSRVDIRSKFPTDPNTGKGMWSALWLRGNTGPGEIDLVEAYSNKPDLTNAWECVVITVWENTNGTGGHKNFVYRFPAGQYPYQVSHDYGVEILSDRLNFTIDGNTVWTPTVATYPWMSTMLTDTWNIRVNQQISAASTYFYAPDAGTVFPRDMLTDYVRVYHP